MFKAIADGKLVKAYAASMEFLDQYDMSQIHFQDEY